MFELAPKTRAVRFATASTIALLAFSAVSITAGGALVTRASTITDNVVAPDYMAERSYTLFAGLGYGDFGQLRLGERRFIPIGQAEHLPTGETWEKSGGESQANWGIDPRGGLHMWGNDAFGRMGTGESTGAQVDTPVQIDFSGTRADGDKITDVAVGAESVFAIDEDGDVVAWGIDDFGRLGTGTAFTGVITPTDIAGSIGPVEKVFPVANGVLFRTQAGKLYGAGEHGVITNNTAGEATSEPTPIEITQFPFSAAQIAQTMDVEPRYRYAGNVRRATILRTTTGAVYSWGIDQESFGYLGHGGTTNVPTATRIPALQGILVSDLQQSREMGTIGALAQNGNVFMWGYGKNNNLGNGATSNVTAPTRLSLPTTTAQLSIGRQHSAALLDNGRVALWGINENGSFGAGLAEEVYARPILVPNDIRPLTHAAVTGVKAHTGSTRLDVVVNADGLRVPSRATVTDELSEDTLPDNTAADVPVQFNDDRLLLRTTEPSNVSGTGTPGETVTVVGEEFPETPAPAQDTDPDEASPGSEEAPPSADTPLRGDANLDTPNAADGRTASVPDAPGVEPTVEPVEKAGPDPNEQPESELADNPSADEEPERADDTTSDSTDKDRVELATAVVNESGSWTVTLPQDLNPDIARLVATQSGDATTDSILVDYVSDVVSVTENADLEAALTGKSALSGVAPDGDLRISVNGVPTPEMATVADGKWSLAIETTTDAPTLVRVFTESGAFATLWLSHPDTPETRS